MTTLKNGATEIARITMNGRTHVMANRHTDYEPFVTWALDADQNTYWGHYFATHDEAAADLIKRAG